MKKLYLNTGSFDAVFNNLKESFGGDLWVSGNEYKLTIKSKWAKGSISGVRFEKEMSYLSFDLTFNQEISLSIESNPFSPVFFAYCEKGNVLHSFGANGTTHCLKKQQSGIMSNSSAINSVLYFQSHQQIQFSIIGMPTSIENNETNFVSQVKKIFTTHSGNYIYIGDENHKIGEKFQELKRVPNQGALRYVVMKSILREVLELEIAQHSYNYLTAFEPILNFAVKQLSEIKRISQMKLTVIGAPVHFLKRNLQPRKYQLALKPFDQKLAS